MMSHRDQNQGNQPTWLTETQWAVGTGKRKQVSRALTRANAFGMRIGRSGRARHALGAVGAGAGARVAGLAGAAASLHRDGPQAGRVHVTRTQTPTTMAKTQPYHRNRASAALLAFAAGL